MLKPVYYIYGTDDYLIEEAIESIKKEALTGVFASMNYHQFEGKSADASDVIAAALTLPAFADKRVVLIRGAENLKAPQQKELIPYINKPSETTCLIFLADTGKIDKGSAFIKALTDGGYLKACNRMYEEELAVWVRKEAKKEGKSISETAARKLVEIAGTRLRDVRGELDKLVLFVGDKTAIDDKDVEDSGLDCREETIFGLSDAIGAKDLKKALKIYGKISGEPLMVLGAISRQIRILLKIKIFLGKGVSSQKLPSMLGLFPKYTDDYIRRSKRFTLKELKGAIDRLKEADSDFKSGRMPQHMVLPKLIMDLCGGR